MVIAVMFSREEGRIELWLNHGSLCICEPSHKSKPMPTVHLVENTVHLRQNGKWFLRLCCFETALCGRVCVYWLHTAALVTQRKPAFPYLLMSAFQETPAADLVGWPSLRGS